MLVKLAWRNIWRNKRRTLITLGMIQFAVVLATLMATLRDGIMESQIDDVVGGFQGYGAISDTGYIKEPIIDRVIPYNDSIESRLKNHDKIKAFSPRIMGGGMMTLGEKFKITNIAGVKPELEDSLTHLSSRLVKGRFIQDAGEVVLGQGLAKRLKADIDSVVFVNGMGYHGNSANLMLKVVGMVKLPNLQEDKRTAFVTLDEASYSFATEGMVSNIALSFDNNTTANATVKKLKSEFSGRVSIYSWDEINESLYMMVVMNDAANVIVSAMLYFIISFGLFGTIIMMLSERKREFGVLIAIGMGKRKLANLVYIENTFMALIGTALGFLIAIPIVYYFNQNPFEITGQEAADMEKFGFNPVLKMSMNIKIFMYQAVTVLGISLLFSLYPILKIRSMNENKAMRA